METKMKLLFEGWRKYVNEAEEKSFDQGPREQWATDLERAEELIEKYSLNTDQSSQQARDRGQPIVDYDVDDSGDELLFIATIQIEPPPIAQRDFGEEMDLERECRRILEKMGLGEDQGLSQINVFTEPYSSIMIDYVPDEQGIENLEPFLKHIAEIAARFQELRITDQLYKQQELPLPEV
tara:strand:+ start:59 stop:601 length:543 start_codon:yes stop_codon:yes gene_type:complete